MPPQTIDIQALLLQQEMRTFVHIFNKLLHHPVLLLEFTSHLDLPDLVNLYSIHPDFHSVANQNLTSIITTQALRLCPESFRIFHFSEYPGLCVPIPQPFYPVSAGIARNVFGHSHGQDEMESQPEPEQKPELTVQLQPTLRWLNMVLYRDKAIDEIIAALAKAGHKLLSGSHTVLKRMWRLSDAPTSAHRMALLRSQYLFADRDLRAAVLFLVKLDMYFAHPFSAGIDEIWPGLRELFINQRSPFAALRDYMVSDLGEKSRAPKSEIDILQMFLQCSPTLATRVTRDDTVFGILQSEIGRLSKAGNGGTLIRIDELVLRESIRRRMELHLEFLGMILYGHDPDQEML